MPKKAERKKRNYKTIIRQKIRDGLINTPSGDWVKAPANSAMARDQYNGYRFNR